MGRKKGKNGKACCLYLSNIEMLKELSIRMGLSQSQLIDSLILSHKDKYLTERLIREKERLILERDELQLNLNKINKSLSILESQIEQAKRIQKEKEYQKPDAVKEVYNALLRNANAKGIERIAQKWETITGILSEELISEAYDLRDSKEDIQTIKNKEDFSSIKEVDDGERED
jgi:hypothetical protein